MAKVQRGRWEMRPLRFGWRKGQQMMGGGGSHLKGEKETGKGPTNSHSSHCRASLLNVSYLLIWVGGYIKVGWLVSEGPVLRRALFKGNVHRKWVCWSENFIKYLHSSAWPGESRKRESSMSRLWFLCRRSSPGQDASTQEPESHPLGGHGKGWDFLSEYVDILKEDSERKLKYLCVFLPVLLSPLSQADNWVFNILVLGHLCALKQNLLKSNIWLREKPNIWVIQWGMEERENSKRYFWILNLGQGELVYSQR